MPRMWPIGDDAGAADAGDQDRPWARRATAAPAPAGPGTASIAGGLTSAASDQLAALDRHEARAEALEAGIVLVAGRLVDLALAAERGLDRLDRDAVGLDAAIAAALADQLVDEDAPVRDREIRRACAGGASRRRRSGRRSGRRRPATSRSSCCTASRSSRWWKRDTGREAGIGRIFVAARRTRWRCARRLRPRIWRAIMRHVELAVHRLAAGHRDGIVVEDLVGDVDAGRDCRADRQQAGMVVGAVAEVLEDVLAGR